MSEISALQSVRYKYEPKFPVIFTNEPGNIAIKKGPETSSAHDKESLKKQFKHLFGQPEVTFKKGANALATKKYKIGVVLSGGPAPGGHNVIAGLLDGIKRGNKNSKLYGFLSGPAGLMNGKYIEITPQLIKHFRNTGGFDIIGSGRDKIETPLQTLTAVKVTKELDLDAVVIIGGDDSNTNAAVLAEHFASLGIDGSKTRVIGVPKTIDGDLKNEFIEASFGFDTATKIYSSLIGNIARDANSAKKYWHFIKLMGRAASHIALECELQTQANVCIISEEVEAKNMTLKQITEDICKVVAKRAENGENFGVVIVPEGVVEFIPEMKKLINELNDNMAKKADEYNTLKTFEQKTEWLNKNLSQAAAQTFDTLPEEIAEEFLLARDPHGNVMVSRIETERLLAATVEKRLSEMKKDGSFKGKFTSYTHFLGYEGRCSPPSNFDANYCYSLGLTAFMLVASGLNGYMASVRNLASPPSKWTAGGFPITEMMNIEMRRGLPKPVIKKALVDIKGAAFKQFAAKRDEWAVKTSYVYPGSVQFFGPVEISDAPTKTLLLEHNDRSIKNYATRTNYFKGGSRPLAPARRCPSFATPTSGAHSSLQIHELHITPFNAAPQRPTLLRKR
jgi:pyrophosphate--fructose-6-phosphate 1-phosphotransferase